MRMLLFLLLFGIPFSGFSQKGCSCGNPHPDLIPIIGELNRYANQHTANETFYFLNQHRGLRRLANIDPTTPEVNLAWIEFFRNNCYHLNLDNTPGKPLLARFSASYTYTIKHPVVLDIWGDSVSQCFFSVTNAPTGLIAFSAPLWRIGKNTHVVIHADNFSIHSRGFQEATFAEEFLENEFGRLYYNGLASMTSSPDLFPLYGDVQDPSEIINLFGGLVGCAVYPSREEIEPRVLDGVRSLWYEVHGMDSLTRTHTYYLLRRSMIRHAGAIDPLLSRDSLLNLFEQPIFQSASPGYTFPIALEDYVSSRFNLWQPEHYEDFGLRANKEAKQIVYVAGLPSQTIWIQGVLSQWRYWLLFLLVFLVVFYLYRNPIYI